MGTDSVRGECYMELRLCTKPIKNPFYHPCMLSLLLFQSINDFFLYFLFHHSSRHKNWMAWAWEGPDFIVAYLYCFYHNVWQKIIYSCCFPASTVIPHFYTFYFPAWEKVCWVHIFILYIWVRQLVGSSLQMKYLVICKIINPEILFFSPY